MKTTSVKEAVSYIPEAFLLVGGMFCVVADLRYGSTPLLTTGMGMGVVAILALLKWKSKGLALVIATLSGSVSLFLMLALLAEFAQYPSGSKEGLQLLLTGSLLFLGLLVISIALPVKYIRLGSNVAA